MTTFLTAQWQNLIFANYEIDPAVLMPYLPKGVELDFFEGKTYVSLVGFMFKDSSIFNIPIPLLGTFEEVNLRFYVVRKVGNETRRGVVFVNETVPNKIVAWVANKLYKEHYTSIPTIHHWAIGKDKKEIEYQWNVLSEWNYIKITASATKHPLEAGSMDEYILEHYYGYTKVNEQYSIEYKIRHPSWNINGILQHEINCDFEAFYGKDFACLNNTKPTSIILAEGSAVSIDWKRNRF